MNLSTKTILTRSLAVLGLVVVAGGAYFLTSSNNGFQANLIAQNVETLPLVNSNQNAPETAQAVSNIFDATPSADAAAAAFASSGSTMTGTVMTGTQLAQTPLANEIEALEDLRPAAANQADSLLNVLGLTNANTNTTVASAVTTTNTEALPSATNVNINSTSVTTQTINANTNAASAALATAPHVPQTGAETWLLTASIVCALMGMTLLLSAPKNHA